MPAAAPGHSYRHWFHVFSGGNLARVYTTAQYTYAIGQIGCHILEVQSGIERFAHKVFS